MPKIQNIIAREILDSRGEPTIEVDLTLDSGAVGRASVPAGASTGAHEAQELRDNDPDRFAGKGVLNAIKNIKNDIKNVVAGKDFDQHTLDATLIELDGTPTKNRLGANAILGVSLAFAHASAENTSIPLWQYFAKESGVENPHTLPTPFINILNGGRHASNSTDFQEFMIVPAGAPTYRDAIHSATKVFHALKKLLARRGDPTTVGDEGGFAPHLASNEMAMDLIMEAITAANFIPGKDIYIAIDSASSEFFENNTYTLKSENRKLSEDELIALYAMWAKKYPLISIEDGLAEDAWEGHSKLTQMLGSRVQLVGDDLFATNTERLKKGIEVKAATAILIKLNQIGTVSETINAIKTAQKAGLGVIISNRSGETEDTSIADLAVGSNALQIKTGSMSRSERMAKYNQLLRIEEALGSQATFAGKQPFKF